MILNQEQNHYRIGEKMFAIAASTTTLNLALGEWAPSLVERLVRIYFSPIFRGLASYLFHQLIGLWAAI